MQSPSTERTVPWTLSICTSSGVPSAFVDCSSAASSERGQGTVEYVGLILLVSMLMVGMVAAMKGFNGTSGTEIAEVIISKIKQAVNAITFR